MDQKRSKKLKRIVSGLLSLTMITSMSAVLPASADETSKQEAYPFAVFAADELGGITLDLDYLTVNGNACTNGVYSTTAKTANINGTISENEFIADETVTDDENTTDAQDGAKAFDVSRDMICIHNKLMSSWFNGAQNYTTDYTLSEMNINLNTPVYVTGKLSYNGNMALNSAVGAVSDVTLSGGNLNGNNAVIYSKFGDIKIDDSQASMNGLIYAPFGTVTIDCDNFNLNGLIIAQNVVISGNMANINYSNTWAEFVGTDSEKLSWTYDDWKYLADTDKDGLPNLIEKEIGTKPYEPDTDGDRLPDGYEFLTLGTDPLKFDTDDNGVSDYDEDFDNDGLSNGREYENGTRPYAEDTDGDNLKDGEEVDKYFTDPLEVDTDKDGLNDDDEIYFCTDPNDPDTDDNGILDGAEKRFQTFTHKVENEDCAVTEVIVSMEGTGNLQKTTNVESVMNRDVLCTDVVGLVGEPFSIETTSKFDKATLTFKIDQSKLGETDFDDLLFLWHDEENHNFEELDTIFDEANSTVSIETTHFSKYMVVDKYKWFDAWAMQFNYNPGREHVGENYAGYNKNYTVLTIDCSGSMSSNDPISIKTNINSAYDAQFPKTCGRISASEKFISLMMGDDLTSIVLFDNYAFDTMDMTDDQHQLKLGLQDVCNRGGTEFLPAIKSSLDMFTEEQLNDTNANKRIILLSDGFDFYPDETKRYLNNLYFQYNTDVRNRVKIYTIALGRSADAAFLEEIANITHGEAYKAYTASELVDIYSDIGIGGDFDTTDTDGDGLYDAVEAAGIRLENGRIIYTDPTTKYTDNDALEDGEEIDPTPRHSNKTLKDFFGNVIRVKGYYFVMNSDPTKSDTDGDGINDDEDPKPFKYTIPYIEMIKKMEDYIDEFWTTDLAYDCLSQGYIVYRDNSIIAMNIIRNIKYGSGSGDETDAIQWYFTSGDSYPIIESYIDSQDPSIMEYFRSDANATFTDPDGNSIDALHMLATLSGQYNTNFIGSIAIDKKLSGWAGDLQSLVCDLIIDTYNTNKDLNTSAANLIATDDTNFCMEDMVSDVDAENIYNLYSSSKKLSYMLEHYYRSKFRDRYSIFLDGYGSIDDLEEKTSEFTYGFNPVKHHILQSFAEKSLEDDHVYSTYEASYVETIYAPTIDAFGNVYPNYILIYSLPDPKVVTQEQGDALTYAFVNFIETHA